MFTEIVGDEVISKPIIQKLKRIVKKNLDETIIDDETERNLDKTFFFNESEINRCGLLIRYICFNGRAEKNIGGKYIAGEIFDASTKKRIVFSEGGVSDFV